MDTDCCICFESHPSIDCPERSQRNCPDCHMLIKRFADHAPFCGMKTWIYEPYLGLYAGSLEERAVIGCNNPMRFYYEGSWRKFVVGTEMYSAECGVVFRSKTDNDFSIMTTSFAPIRIMVVVRENGTFFTKLLLLSSRGKFFVAKPMNELFDRGTAKAKHTWKTTLILAIGSTESLCLSIMVVPLQNAPRIYEMNYYKLTNQFDIPHDINLGNLDIANSNCVFCYGAHHNNSTCKKFLSKCFDCHVVIEKKQDHAEACSVSELFNSVFVDVYAKIPAVRLVLSFGAKIGILSNGSMMQANTSTEFFSGMADTLFTFESPSKVVIKTTEFTRIRIPIVIQESNNRYIEKLVFMTSHDRTVIVAPGSRVVNNANILNDFKHNTPIALFVTGQNFDISVTAHSGGNIFMSEVVFDRISKKYKIPQELYVKSNNFVAKIFDANLPFKKMKRP